MTLSEIYTQQVMNNLAMFLQNPDALPFFAFPNQGTTSVQDTGNVGNPGYTSTHFATSPFGLNGSRMLTENWVLSPISDPAKLGLMRCAYRQAIASCIGIDMVSESGCPNCRKLRRQFYGPPEADQKDPHFNEEQPCLNSPCWLRGSCKKHVPKSCAAPYVGYYGGLYVWVDRTGYDMLTRLTLAILDYATNDPKQFDKRTKSVELYLTKDGDISDSTTGTKIIATIPIDQPSRVLKILDQPAYGRFYTLYGKDMAEQIEDIARIINPGYDMLPYEDEEAEMSKTKFWLTADLTDPRWQELGERGMEALKFAKKHKLVISDMPDEDVFHGPVIFERKGTASSGLQQLGQQLNAANPSGLPSSGK